MSALTGRTPDEVFDKFRSHLSRLLNKTVTDAPLSVIKAGRDERAFLSFRRNKDPIAAPIHSSDLFLYVGQVIAVERHHKDWRLRTLKYRYWIQGDAAEDTDSWFFRFEYVSREIRSDLHPRHHLHLPCSLRCGKKDRNLTEIHIPTGWVTLEEVIRFLINELNAKPRSDAWDEILIESENQFKEWTSRTV